MPAGPGSVSQGPGPGPGLAPQPQGSPPAGLTPGSTSLPFRPPPSPRSPPPPPGPPVASPGAPAGPRPGTPTFKVSPRDERDVDGPPTVAWQPSGREGPPDRSADEIDPTPGQGTPAVDDHDSGDADPQEQALDDFFEDDDSSGYLSERRFGGRLRRRR